MQQEEFCNLLNIKKHLITTNELNMSNKINSEKDFLIFLNSLLLLIKTEDAFLYLSSNFITKVEDIINSKRFIFQSKEVNNLVNAICVKLNELKGLANNIKHFKIYNYLDYQNEIRHISYLNLENFLGAMALDYDVFLSLLNHNVGDFPYDEVFLSATNYFLEVYPELYENKEFFYLTLEKLNNIKMTNNGFKNRNLKQYAKMTAMNFRNKCI